MPREPNRPEKAVLSRWRVPLLSVKDTRLFLQTPVWDGLHPGPFRFPVLISEASVSEFSGVALASPSDVKEWTVGKQGQDRGEAGEVPKA